MPFRRIHLLPIIQGLLYPLTFTFTLVLLSFYYLASPIIGVELFTIMPFKRAYVIPIVEGLLYPITFTITYTLSVVNQDVPALFPYISDTGVWSLERCIFSFMLGFGSLLMYIIIYIRVRQIQEILVSDKETRFKPRLKTLNKISVYCAAISVFGLFMLGCFQVWPFIYVHICGAGMCFSFGWFVLAIQTYISFVIYPTLGSKCMNVTRAILVLIVGVATLLTGVFGVLSLTLFKGDDITQWTENSGGYEYHLVSVASEWVLVLSVVLYLSLYTGEFRSIIMYKPKLEIVNI